MTQLIYNFINIKKNGKRGNDPQNTTIREVGGNTIYWFR
jgi:hypothetical protein